MGNDTKDMMELLRLLGEKTPQDKDGKKNFIGIIPDEILAEFLNSADEERREFEFLERSFNKEQEKIVKKHEREIEGEMVDLYERYQDMANHLAEDMRNEHEKRWGLIYDHFEIQNTEKRRFGIDRDLKLLYEVKNK